VAGVDRIPSAQLANDALRELRGLFNSAFGKRFSDGAFDHCLGGTHFVIAEDGRVISHASVVSRTLKVGEVQMSAGYVEAVATEPHSQHRGFGSVVMEEVAELLRESFDIGALATGGGAFYTRLGWEQWRGPTFVDAPAGRVRTADADGAIYVLRTPGSATIDLADTLTCDWRLGHVW
jgi:aminoglycoside 2'-N-acetyltransferase I